MAATTDPQAPTPERVVHNPMAAFVKGGTTTRANDEKEEREFLDAERRRNVADRERELAAIPIEQGGAVMNRADLRGPQGATYIHVKYVSRYGDQYTDGLADIIIGTSENPMEMVLMVVCPKCVRRKRHGQDCQMRILKSNKDFDFVPHMGKFFEFDDGNGVVRYRSAGTIRASEKLTCHDCDYTARFDNDRLIED